MINARAAPPSIKEDVAPVRAKSSVLFPPEDAVGDVVPSVGAPLAAPSPAGSVSGPAVSVPAGVAGAAGSVAAGGVVASPAGWVAAGAVVASPAGSEAGSVGTAVGASVGSAVAGAVVAGAVVGGASSAAMVTVAKPSSSPLSPCTVTTWPPGAKPVGMVKGASPAAFVRTHPLLTAVSRLFRAAAPSSAVPWTASSSQALAGSLPIVTYSPPSNSVAGTPRSTGDSAGSAAGSTSAGISSGAAGAVVQSTSVVVKCVRSWMAMRPPKAPARFVKSA